MGVHICAAVCNLIQISAMEQSLRSPRASPRLHPRDNPIEMSRPPSSFSSTDPYLWKQTSERHSFKWSEILGTFRAVKECDSIDQAARVTHQ